MPSQKKLNATKKEIIQIATRLFLERGFADTSVKLISDTLGISTGNLTFHYPTKEHLLSVLVKMLCDFQWHSMETVLDEGSSPLMALCLELAAMTTMCEESEIAREFYLSAYTHTMTLNTIRENDQKKYKKLFAPYTTDWEEWQFVEAETLVSGVEYGTLMNTPCSPELHVRLGGALRAIMKIYHVPDEECNACIARVFQMDYRSIGQQVLKEFTSFVHNISETQLEQYLLKQ